MTSTPSNTFGMSWNADSEPGLISKHQRSPSPSVKAMPNEAESLPSHFLWNTIEAALRGGLCGFVATNAARSGDRKKKKKGRESWNRKTYYAK